MLVAENPWRIASPVTFALSRFSDDCIVFLHSSHLDGLGFLWADAGIECLALTLVLIPEFGSLARCLVERTAVDALIPFRRFAVDRVRRTCAALYSG